MRNLDYDTATRQLKSLSELASRLAAQTPKIDEIVEGVQRLTTDDSRKSKSILQDLGTLQEASRSANQLMSQKSELESRIGVMGKYLITEHMYLQVRFHSFKYFSSLSIHHNYACRRFSTFVTFEKHRNGL